MRLTPCSALAIALLLPATRTIAQSPRVLSAEELTSVRSLVGGTTLWYPDGTSLLIGGALGGSDLWRVPSSGGFPQSLNLRLGETAFLQSTQVRFSPDGKWISWLSLAGHATELWAHSLTDGRTRQVTRLGARINSYAWAPDSRRLAVAADTYGNFDIWIADLEGASRRMTSDVRYEVFPTWTPDGSAIAYVRLDEKWLDHDVRLLSATGTGAARTIVSDTDFFDYQAGGTFGYPQISPNGQQLLFRSHRNGWVNYWVVPLQGGTPRVLAAEAANQSGARWSPDGASVLYLALWNGTQDLRVVPAAGGPPRVVAKPETMGVIANADWSPDGREIAYTLESPVAPADLYVVPAVGGAPRQLTRSTGPAYLTNALIRPKKITYKSKDGFSIAAYLYEPILPVGVRAPGILYIHGGPTSSFNDTYQAEAQHLAMRGYAVLLPNIRGSSGYGKPFEDANNGCWGRCDLIDVTAGVEFLRTLPFVDGANMGITGTSYGGCMSLAASAFAPGVFQAAAAVSGYGDWIHMIQEQEMRHLKLVEYEFGPLATQEARYKASSPIFNIKDIQTPIMLLHGVGAQLPRSEASRIFADRLEMNYKPFLYKTYPNENYYVRRRENLVAMYTDIAAWFDLHLKRPVRTP